MNSSLRSLRLAAPWAASRLVTPCDQSPSLALPTDDRCGERVSSGSRAAGASRPSLRRVLIPVVALMSMFSAALSGSTSTAQAAAATRLHEVTTSCTPDARNPCRVTFRVGSHARFGWRGFAASANGFAAPANSVAAPANDDFANATAITGEHGSIAVSTFGASQEAGELPRVAWWGSSPSVYDQSVWFKFTPPRTAYYDFVSERVDTTYPDGVVGTITYDGDSLSTLQERYNSVGVQAWATDVSLFPPLEEPYTAGTTYYVKIAAPRFSTIEPADSHAATLTLTWDLNAPDNDLFENAQTITGASGSVSGNARHAQLQPGEPNPQGSGLGTARSIWYRWTAPYDGTGLDFQVAYDGNHVGPYATNVYSGSTLSTLENADAIVAGETYFIQFLDNSGSEAPPFTLSWSMLGPALLWPANGALVPTTSVTLTANKTTDLEQDPFYYEFQVFKDRGLTQSVADSGPVLGNLSYVPPPGVLEDGTQYWWRVVASDSSGGSVSSSEVRTFAISELYRGSRAHWLMWRHGPVSVNEGSGNAIIAAPAPSYPAAALSLGLAVTFNSFGTVEPPFGTDDQGLGAGWTISAGSSDALPPLRLIDHSSSGITDPRLKFDAVERVNGDGSTDYYGHIAGSASYVSPPGDRSRLTQAETGFTLTDPDGSIYTYGPQNNVGVANLTSAELAAAAPGQDVLTYTFSGTKPVKITDSTTGHNLALNWNSVNAAACPGAILCVKLCLDAACTNAPAGTWKYIGDATGGTSGRLLSVNDGVRTVAQYTYYSEGLVSSVQNADDIASNTHSIFLYYGDFGAQYPSRAVELVREGPTTGQMTAANGVSEPYSDWSFSYETPCTAGLDAPTVAAHLTGRSAATSCALVTPPRLEGVSPAKFARIFFDNVGRPIETVDAFGRHRLSQWNANNQILWTEDELGNPSDYSYDPFDNVLTQAQAPPTALIGGTSRPTTSYGYDEQTISGNKLTGLQGWYYRSVDLSGRPAYRRTDAQVAVHWGAGSPAGLPATNWSVRWVGELNVATVGAYTFTTTSDGTSMPSRLTIDSGTAGSPLYHTAIDNWASAARTDSSQPIQLSAGMHRVVLEYAVTANSGGDRGITLSWSCPCGPSGVIPTTALAPAWLNRTSVVDPAGRRSFSHYTQPDTGEPDYTLRQVNGQKVITSFSYDAFGRITQKVMPKGNTSRTFDATTGALTGAPDLDYAASYSYYAATDTRTTPVLCGTPAAADQSALLKTVSQHGLAGVTTIYDAVGRAVSTTNGRGTTATCYDAENRITKEQAPGDTQPTIYTYTPSGLPLTAQDANGTITNTYDEAGRVTDRRDSQGAETGYVYDTEGNIVTRTADTGPVGAGSPKTVYVYDDGDRLQTLTDPASEQYSFYYDERSLLHATQYPNGTFSWRDYNQSRWLTGLYNRAGMLPATLPATVPVGSSLADFTYSYNADGKMGHQVRNAPAGGDHPAVSDETTSYGYDNLGRLMSSNLPTARVYCYDLDSNRTSIATTSCTDANPTATYLYQQASAPGDDQLTGVDQLGSSTQGGVTTTYGYDSDGDTTRRGTDTLNWDGWGRSNGGLFPAAGVNLRYSYDSVGDLRERTATENYRAVVLADHPQGYWRLSEIPGTATATDLAPTPHDATYTATGVTLGGAGAIGDDPDGAAAFDGANGSASAAGVVPNSTFTIEAWVKAAAAQTDRGITGRWRLAGEASPGGVMLWIDNAGHYALAVTSNSSNYLTTTASPTVGGWDYLVGTFDGTIVRLYLNGVQIGQKNFVGSFGSPTVAFEIGRYAGLSAKGFNGTIDDVALYGSPLSQQQIAIHYTAAQPMLFGSGYRQQVAQDNPSDYWRLGETTGTTATDAAGGNHPGSYSATGVTLGQQGSQSADTDSSTAFSGSSSFVSASGVPNFSGAFTIEAWVRSAAIQSDKGIAGKWRAAGEASAGGAMLWINNSGNYTLAVTNSAANYLATSASPIPGVWEYIVGTYDGSTLRLYRNGVLVTSKGFTGSIGAPTVPFEIGRYAGVNTTNFNGRLDEVAIYPAALSAGRILAHYKKGRDLRDTHYLDGGLYETSPSGTTTLSAVAGPGGDLAHYSGPPAASTAVTYLYYNGHGDLAAEAGSAGTRTNLYSYDAFGAPVETVPANATTERWTGSFDKKLDTATGLVVMGVRPYDAALGRFLSADPIDGGSLNNYDYAGEDPINGYDGNGQACLCVPKVVKKAVRNAKEATLEVAQEAPYGLYYASYQALGATSTGSDALNIASDVLTPRGFLVATEAAGFGGNAAVDIARGKSMWDDARRDSILPNFIAQYWNPPWLQTYLPGGGTRPDGSHFIDFHY